MTEPTFTKKMNKRLDSLFDLYPIDDLRATEVTEQMKEGLAKCYAHQGFRAYLENAIKIALKNLAVAPDPTQIAYFKSRVDVLEQLLAKGKQLYTTTELTKEMRKVVIR